MREGGQRQSDASHVVSEAALESRLLLATHVTPDPVHSTFAPLPATQHTALRPLHKHQQLETGRAEFVSYLPEATQGVIVQPLGSSGVMVVGTDTLRGLSRLDQVCMSGVCVFMYSCAVCLVVCEYSLVGTDTLRGLRLDQVEEREGQSVCCECCVFSVVVLSVCCVCLGAVGGGR